MLSVIVPVYNTSLTLKRCLDSIISQALSDWEVIIVDDGSNDGSSSMADEYAYEYPFIHAVHQRNKGLSAARNRGIEESKGDILTFVDSDDWLMPGVLNHVVTQMADHPECDLFEYSVVVHRGMRTRSITLPDQTFTAVRDYWLTTKAFTHAYAWNKVYRRSFLDSTTVPVRFDIGKVYEDALFMAKVVALNPVVRTSSFLGYSYEWNASGITSTASGYHLVNLLVANLSAAQSLGITFGDTFVPAEETAFYLSLLNTQITVCRLTCQQPILPERKVHFVNTPGLKMKIKVFFLNTVGLRRLCAV